MNILIKAAGFGCGVLALAGQVPAYAEYGGGSAQHAERQAEPWRGEMPDIAGRGAAPYDVMTMPDPTEDSLHYLSKTHGRP